MFGVKFIKFEPTEYVLKYKNGKIVEEGTGLSFFYYAPTTSLVMIPMGAFDVPFIFEEVTKDFQTITVQGKVSFRIAEPKKIAQILNFTLLSKFKGYSSDDPEKLQQKIINSVKVLAKKNIGTMDLRSAIVSEEGLAKKVVEEIRKNDEVNLLGIEVMGLSILAVLPNKETARALEAQTREEILKRADDALYERRNSAIEQERKIKENELSTEITVENKKREIKETQMAAEKSLQSKKNEMKEEQMKSDISLEEKKKVLIELKTKNAREEADAKAYELSSMMKALDGTSPEVIQSLAGVGMKPEALIAMAFKNIAGNAEKIGQLNISPDLLNEIMKREK